MFEGEIVWISPFFKSRREGFYRIVTISIYGATPERAKVFLGPENRNYSKWEPLLREGAVIKNLIWKDRAKATVDADSPVEIA